MLDRRTILALPISLAACAASARVYGPRAMLNRAIDAAGGVEALQHARVLAWTGQARIHVPGRVIEIGVNTVVEPFTYARSETWLLEQGPGSTRTLEIDGNQGWQVRGGERTPMAAPALEHERQQFALYGLMRLAPLRDETMASVEYAPLPADAPPGVETALIARHVAAPETLLMFDTNARLVAADNIVADPAEGAEHPIRQRFLFGGTIEGAGVRWPRTLAIYQEGALFFELELSSFTPRPVR